MTTLLSKGMELEQGLRKGLEQTREQIRKELETRGLKMSAADIAALVEEMAPGASKAALTGAMEFLKPFSVGLGFRVTRLTDTQIELLVPVRPRSRNDEGQLHEGVLLAAGIEAAKLLWARHAPLGEFGSQVLSARLDLHRPASGEVRVRLELPETTRENLLSLLRQNREALSDMSLRFVDEGEQEIAQLDLSLRLRHQPALEAPEARGPVEYLVGG